MPDNQVLEREAAQQPSQQPLHSLLLLLELHQEARHAPSVEALRFLLLNQTRRLIAYRQAAARDG